MKEEKTLYYNLKKEDLKKEIAIRRERMEKRKLLEYIKQMDIGSEIEIIEPTENYIKKVRELCKIDYPISQIIEKQSIISKLAKIICFDKEDIIILPCFNDTSHWIKLKVGEKEKFFRSMFSTTPSGFFLLCPERHILYDIDMGEKEYEIYVAEDC